MPPSSRCNFFDDDTSDLTSTKSQCFFWRRPTLNAHVWQNMAVKWLQNMCIMLSARVLKPCMLLEFCEHTAWTMPHYRRSAERLSTPSWLTAPVPGGGTPAQLIDNGLKHSSDEVIEAVSLQPICRPSQSCAWQLMRSYLRPLSETIITFYISSCHHYDLRQCRHNTFLFLQELVI